MDVISNVKASLVYLTILPCMTNSVLHYCNVHACYSFETCPGRGEIADIRISFCRNCRMVLNL